MNSRPRFRLLCLLALIFLASASPAHGATREYRLTIGLNQVDFTGRKVHGMTINGTIPGPVLVFNEGDLARIHVTNEMDVPTSIHWHGLLVPPGMDGVPYVSFPPIAPGSSFTYEFPIRQSGTYWYHSHSNLQEQRGVYGGIVIHPRESHARSDRDVVVLLSDWTDMDPHEVLRTLKRGSEWFALAKGNGQSLLGALKMGMVGDYFRRELMRMPPMDLSDVAYDRFLANGRPEISIDANPGETIRLRIIDGSATTFFHLDYAGGSMRIVSADGQEVVPTEVKRLLVGVAETYDLLVTVPGEGAYELRATSHDGSGYASVWIGSGPRKQAPAVPRPNLYHAMGHGSMGRLFALTPEGTMGMDDHLVEKGMFDAPGMMGMGHAAAGQDHGEGREPMAGHGHRGHGMDGMAHQEPMMSMPEIIHGQPAPAPEPPRGNRYARNFLPLAPDVAAAANLARDGDPEARPWPPYEKLKSPRRTGFDPAKPVREIRLTLDGDMERYVWSLNNKTLSEEDTILIRKDEVVRFIMINRTMMHHPMHLHGHFFRVINGQGDHAPLKHTVDVAPMSTTVIEFDANEVGDWFFHCHLLYHMKSGMARMVHYQDFEVDPALASSRANLRRDDWYGWGTLDLYHHKNEGSLTFADTRNILNAWWEVGWENVEETEWEGLLTWSRYRNRFLSLFTGFDLLGESNEMERARGVAGISYLLPFNIKTRAWIDWDKGGRVSFDKEFTLTPRLTLAGEAEYDSHTKWEGEITLSYQVSRGFAVIGQWHSDFAWGAGIRLMF